MLCIAAMVIFAIMGIFSAKYRTLSKEAFSCAFRMVTGRACITNFDQRMRVKIAGPIISKNKIIGRFIYKYFKTLSVIFVLLFFASAAYTGLAIYNLTVHGECDPSDPDSSCVFAPEKPVCGMDDIPEDVSCEDPECEVHNFKILNGGL